MEIISLNQIDMTEHGKSTKGSVYTAHVKISDVEGRADEMIKMISDTSWIEKLGAVEKISFEARSKRTIEKLVGLISDRTENEVTTDFGEFMVSSSAQMVLVDSFNHSDVPLAELLKEKISGNAGFDFHTESETNFISFGEAKYSGIISPHQNALNQIAEFINLGKDSMELVLIERFVSENAVSNYQKGKKAYVAAFSIKAQNPESIILNAIKLEAIDSLLGYNEIYIIGIEVDA